MKIFLLNPNFNLEKKSVMNVRFRQPLELAYIASLLRSDGAEIKLLDANVLNLTLAQAIAEIKKFAPDILIVTSSPLDRWECPQTHIDHVFQLINQAAARHKILIGAHGSTQPEWIFKNCQVDFVVRGEPEMIVKELVGALSENKDFQHIKGISWLSQNIVSHSRPGSGIQKRVKKFLPPAFCVAGITRTRLLHSHNVIHNSPAERILNLDALPLPAYDLLPMEKYSAGDFTKTFSIMMTSRGCPFQCTFCLKAMMPGKFIARSPENVIEEIKYLIGDFGVKSIYFQDWEFLIDAERVKRICELIINEHLKFFWGCNARASDIAQNRSLIAFMKQAGCVKINMGLESGSEKILNNINKKITVKVLQEAHVILTGEGISPGFYMLLNCPGEDETTLRATVDFIVQNELKVKSFNPVVPYPGTALYEDLIRQEKQEVSWDKIEKYAGRVRTVFSPRKAKWLVRHYKWQRIHGKRYYLKLGFWRKVLLRKP